MYTVFGWTPSYTTQKNLAPRARVAALGLLSQREPDGINVSPRAWTLYFNAEADIDADAIDAFLAARSGDEPFYWQMPDGTVSLFTSAHKTRVCSDAGISQFTLQFNEAFVLDPALLLDRIVFTRMALVCDALGVLLDDSGAIVTDDSAGPINTD